MAAFNLPAHLLQHPQLEDIVNELLRYRRLIETQTLNGVVVHSYNFNLLDGNGDLPSLERLTNTIYSRQTFVFKTNVSCGFLLQNTRTKEIKFWYPSLGNASLFEMPCRIDNRDSWNEFVRDFHEKDILQHAFLQRPNTQVILFF